MKRRVGACSIALLLLTAGCKEAEKVSFPEPCTSPPGPNVEWARCNLIGADLRGANLKGASIHDVVLDKADLTGANIESAYFVRVYAEDAILRDASLKDSTISGGNIQKAVFCNTTMPDGKIANGDC